MCVTELKEEGFDKLKLRKLSVKNFRGITELVWPIPATGLICLIGKGDSTKSSVLDAIRFLLHPAWNPNIDPFDFQNGDTSKHIEITGVLGELPTDFLSDAKYGHCLQGWDLQTESLHDEPGDGLEEVISAKFSVDNELQPQWRVVTDRVEGGVNFQAGDRAKASANFIGVYTDRQLSWGRNTVLSKVTELENIADSLTSATRAARDALDQKRDTDLIAFDTASQSVEDIARSYGVPVSAKGAYKAQLDTSAVSVQMGGLALHDGEIPLRTLGLGSRRLLVMGIEQQGLSSPHITLVDEIEFGLEPHRIARLLKNLAEDGHGQYFITTHSPVVLRELTVKQLFVVQNSPDKVSISSTHIPALANLIQGKIRSGAESFLGRNVVVCEGATEVGFCRGLDALWISKEHDPFAFTGTTLFDANGGSNVREAAVALHTLGYRVAVIVDSDADSNFSIADKNQLEELGVHVTYWEGGFAIEQYLFSHLPWRLVIFSVLLAKRLHGNSVLDQLRNQNPNIKKKLREWEDTPQMRKDIGKASLGSGSGKNAWFKRQSSAEQWVSTIAAELGNEASVLGNKVQSLNQWIQHG